MAKKEKVAKKPVPEKVMKKAKEILQGRATGKAELKAKLQEMRNRLAAGAEEGLRQEIEKLQEEYNAM